LDYTAALHQQAGIGRYVRELAGALIDSAPPDSLPIRLFAAGGQGQPAPDIPHTRWHPSVFSERGHARLWQRLNLPLPVEVWTGRLDVFHATDFTLPSTLPDTRTVLTIHDLSFERFPQDTMPGMLEYLRRVVPRSAQRADHIIAVSEATRRDLIELYHLPPEKITAIGHGVSGEWSPASGAEIGRIRQKYGISPDADYILTVGTLQPRKNHLRLVQAFARLKGEARLVISGGEGWRYEGVREEMDRLKIGGRVIFTGRVEDSELRALYSGAAVMAYPALYEGFGLPVLEAMACGAPVLASNTSSLPEVLGSAGLLVDPLEVEALTAGIDRLLGDESLRRGLRSKGLARAAEFTWERAARATWEVYQKVESKK
jgi:glycosyltransferase involved in cell wall biosynthesis